MASAGWVRNEALGAAQRQAETTHRVASWIACLASARGLLRDVTSDDLDLLLAKDEPSKADLRALAAYLVWSTRRQPRPPPLLERLPEIQRFLERHEKLL